MQTFDEGNAWWHGELIELSCPLTLSGSFYYYYEQKTQVQKAVANVRKITICWSRGPPTPAAPHWAIMSGAVGRRLR